MKWYTCLNEEGLDRYGEHLRLAIASARAKTSLEPHILFDGERAALESWIGKTGYTVHLGKSSMWDAIAAIPEKPGYKHRIAAGAFLRMDIPLIEDRDDFVVYTDCDVLFQADPHFDTLKPTFLAAAPGMSKDDWSTFNSGVLLMNVANLRAEHTALTALAATKLAIPEMMYDEGVYNIFFRDRWDRLPLPLHWKPYWGIDERAPVIHFHGPKLAALRYLIDGAPETVVHDIWREMYERDEPSYRFYYAALKAVDAPAKSWWERLLGKMGSPPSVRTRDPASR